VEAIFTPKNPCLAREAKPLGQIEGAVLPKEWLFPLSATKATVRAMRGSCQASRGNARPAMLDALCETLEQVLVKTLTETSRCVPCWRKGDSLVPKAVPGRQAGDIMVGKHHNAKRAGA
jgi:hypothetical protein